MFAFEDLNSCAKEMKSIPPVFEIVACSMRVNQQLVI